MLESEQRLIEAVDSLTQAVDALRCTIERSGPMGLDNEALNGLDPTERAILDTLSDPDRRVPGKYDRKEVTHLAQRVNLELGELDPYLNALEKRGLLKRYPAARERDGKERVRRIRQGTAQPSDSA